MNSKEFFKDDFMAILKKFKSETKLILEVLADSDFKLIFDTTLKQL